jgi:hypothetical protein
MRTFGTLALLGLLTTEPAHALGRLADIQVYDRTAKLTLPVYEHEGRYYVAGEPRHEYQISVNNVSGARILAVASVDGVNVLSGETAAPDQDGYVLSPQQSYGIAGWRKSMDRIAAFYFTKLKDSYASRTGRPDDVGVIGVAVFRERSYCCWPWRSSRDEFDDSRAAGAAESESLAKSAPGAQRREERIGTGHGRSEHSEVSYTNFERASDTPDEVITIYYDSRKNLVAQGVIPQPRYYGYRSPRPFPGAGFVPDP